MKTLPAIITLSLISFGSAAVSAQNTVALTSNSKPIAQKYDGVYVVVKADLKKDLLLSIEEQLKPWGVTFKVTDVTYKDGLITGITVYVAVTDYNGTLTVGDKQRPIEQPLIFFSEAGKNGLAAEVPTDLSRQGTLVVTDNLKGMLVLHNGESMQTMGSLSTNWKYPWNK